MEITINKYQTHCLTESVGEIFKVRNHSSQSNHRLTVVQETVVDTTYQCTPGEQEELLVCWCNSKIVRLNVNKLYSKCIALN